MAGISGLTCALPDVKLAEGVRFELTRDLRPCRFSRPVPSTARPTFLSLRKLSACRRLNCSTPTLILNASWRLEHSIVILAPRRELGQYQPSPTGRQRTCFTEDEHAT